MGVEDAAFDGELGPFTTLVGGTLTASPIAEFHRLHARGLHDLLDARLALGFLERDGEGATALYANTAETVAS